LGIAALAAASFVTAAETQAVIASFFLQSADSPQRVRDWYLW